MANPIVEFVGKRIMDAPAQRRSIAELAQKLEQDGRELSQFFSKVRRTPRNHGVFTHIIGIERWGQRRLRIALGEPPTDEEYDAYRPPRDADWDDLIAQFDETRRETVRIAREIEAAGRQDAAVPHNMFGAFSVRGWLRYLTTHANLESRKMF